MSNDFFESLKRYCDINEKGRDLLTQIAKNIPKQEFAKIQEFAYRAYTEDFKKIKARCGNQKLGLSEFVDYAKDYFPMMDAVSAIQELFAQYHFWDSGEKIYNIHPNLCQRFLATNIRSIPIDLFKFPFPAFKLLLPDNVLPVTTFLNEKIFIKEIFVTKFYESEIKQDLILIFHRTIDDVGYFKIGLTENEVHKCVDRSVEYMIEFEKLKQQSGGKHDVFDDERQAELRNIFEFIIKNILYITGANSDVQWIDETDDLMNKMKGLKSSKKIKKLQRRLERARKMYLVGHNIILSREERLMYDNISKGLWKLSYRFIVQGHWRHQAYGPGRQERKLIFIEPFWKGPAYSEIINNPHLIK